MQALPMNIHKKLIQIQQSLSAPKGQYNSFGKYNYRSCEDILEAVKPLLRDAGLTLLLSDTVKEIGGRIYVEATATLYDIDSMASVSVTAFAREEESKKGMDGSQVTGASSSYARKYALNGLFCIDDNKDSDATNKGEEPLQKPKQEKPQPKPAPPPSQENENLYFRCEQCGNKLSPYINDKGEEIPIRRHVETSKKVCDGKVLCRDCAIKYVRR